MGASESTGIQVSFSRPSLFYFAGEQLSGTISFQNTRDKLTLDGIFLELVGEIGFTTLETRRRQDSNGRSHTENYTEYHRVPFMNYRLPVVQPQYGQREITLYQGQHSWPFELRLPDCLPPSLIPSSVSYPYVKYYTRIVLNKPWYKPDAKQVYPLTIFPRVNLLQIQAAQHPVAFEHKNRKKVQLYGTLLQGGTVPGQPLRIRINLQNPKRAEIKRIEATLIQHRQVARSHHCETIFRVDLPNLREFNDTELQQNFDLLVPAVYLSPTYTFMPQQCGPSLGISIYYELVLEVKARGLFTDFKVTVPVIIGTEPAPNQTTQENQHNGDYAQANMATAPVFDPDDLPPSYESVVNSEKA